MDFEIVVQLLTLVLLEIVLGVDNLVFVSILADKLPAKQQKIAWRVGLMGAMLMRIGLLLTLSFIMGLTKPWFTLMDHAVSGRDLILLLGGLFLIYKSATEVYNKVELKEHHDTSRGGGSLMSTITQIMLLDIVFSLDSVITAVGMSNQIWVMVTAIVVSVGVMIALSGKISGFINEHPSVKILALSFLFMIGTVLVMDGFGSHVEKGFVYVAMGFALIVELLNMRYRRKVKQVKKD